MLKSKLKHSGFLLEAVSPKAWLRSPKGNLFLAGFTIVETVVVLGIIAVLTAVSSISFFISKKNTLFLEQITQEMVAEIRLAQSNILAVQKMDIDGDEFIPKAVAMKLENNKKPIIYYLKQSGADCSSIVFKEYKSIDMGNRGKINVTSPGSPVYIIFNSPFGKFFGVSAISDPEFENGLNNSCEPKNYSSLSEDINFGIANDSNTYNIIINKETGNATIGNE